MASDLRYFAIIVIESWDFQRLQHVVCCAKKAITIQRLAENANNERHSVLYLNDFDFSIYFIGLASLIL